MNDQDTSAALTTTTLITRAISDVTPRHNLADVLLSIQSDGLQDDLDALSLLPLLLPCPRDGTDGLLALIGHHCSAKEVVIAVQEVIESLKTESGEESDDESESESVRLVVQLLRLLSLLTKTFPRLVLRKSLSQTLAPLAELEQLLSPAAKHATVAEVRSLVRSAVILVQELGVWAREKAGDDLSELAASHAVLESLLNDTLGACADRVQSAIAQRVFGARFPRFGYRPTIPQDWKDGDDAVRLALDASNSLGCGLSTLQLKPSLASLVLIAHAPASEHLTIPVLESLFPIILTCLQSNVGLDSTLAVLLKVLCIAPPPQEELSSDLIIPLTTVLPPLCSVHPDASTRHIAFRILGHVLHLTPSVLRLQILCELISPSEDGSPHMRVAAIGLVKEAVLEALSDLKAESVFASPFLLQNIGLLLLRLDPPDLLVSISGVDELKDSPEPARLVECLNLYYILLSRDVENTTGIRDPGIIQSIEVSLLGPIRSALGKWKSAPSVPVCRLLPLFYLTEALPLAALQISMERVDDALEALT
ncbi:hypothetical protein BC827DRAFT_1341469 [Russula dissimulans]|nr:hypothetical protein BC827DRAFT_1341469 [Russula dissimulans]